MLSIISTPFQEYLLQRSDTIKCIVTSLTYNEGWNECEYGKKDCLDMNVEDMTIENEDIEIDNSREQFSPDHVPSFKDGFGNFGLKFGSDFIAKGYHQYFKELTPNIQTEQIVNPSNQQSNLKNELDNLSCFFDDVRTLPRYAVPKNFTSFEIGEMDFLYRYNQHVLPRNKLNKSSKGNSSHEGDNSAISTTEIMDTLVHVYGTFDKFVQEYVSQLSNRILYAFFEGVLYKELDSVESMTLTDANCPFIQRESRYLVSLKERFGDIHLENCEVMVKDASFTRSINKLISVDRTYQESYKSLIPSKIYECATLDPRFEMYVLVYSREFWPSSAPFFILTPSIGNIAEEFLPQPSKLNENTRSVDQTNKGMYPVFKIPAIFDQFMDIYKTAFSKFAGKRSLVFDQNFGKVLLEIHVTDVVEMGQSSHIFKFLVSPVQASIISLFSKSTYVEKMDVDVGDELSDRSGTFDIKEFVHKYCLTSKQIASNLTLSRSIIRNKLQFWIKHKIIKEISPGVYCSFDNYKCYSDSKQTTLENPDHSFSMETAKQFNLFDATIVEDDQHNVTVWEHMKTPPKFDKNLGISGLDSSGDSSALIELKPFESLKNEDFTKYSKDTRYQIIWLYIKNMLTNMEKLTLERMHNILKVFIRQMPTLSSEFSKFSTEDLEKFLTFKINGGLLTFCPENLVYRLSSPP